MLPPAFRRPVAVLLAAACLVQSSCGTLLYPERVGQPRGRLDIGVVALDGIGLLVFFVPGAVSFIVDFMTGAIYLPPDCIVNPVSNPVSQKTASGDLVAVHVDPRKLTPERIAAIIRARTGRDVKLTPGAYRAARIASLDEFRDASRQLVLDERPSHATAVIFRCQSE